MPRPPKKAARDVTVAPHPSAEWLQMVQRIRDLEHGSRDKKTDFMDGTTVGVLAEELFFATFFAPVRFHLTAHEANAAGSFGPEQNEYADNLAQEAHTLANRLHRPVVLWYGGKALTRFDPSPIPTNTKS